MALILIRHAPALDRQKWQKISNDDSLRPLTSKGKAMFKKVAKRLPLFVSEINTLYSSPYIRASKTAKLVHKVFPKCKLKFTATAHPDELFFRKLINSSKIYAFVGHEPYLSSLVEKLTAAKFSFPKGGMMYLHKDRQTIQVSWFLSPKFLQHFKIS